LQNGFRLVTSGATVSLERFIDSIMQKIWLYLVVSLGCARILAAQENLVVNSEFAKTSATSQMPDGWQSMETRGDRQVLQDLTVTRDGKASVRFTGDTNSKCTLASPRFEIAPQDEVHLETWVRQAALPSSQPVNAALAFRNRDGRILQREFFHATASDQHWVLIAGNARAPGEAITAEVQLRYTNSPGTVWFSDVKATVTSPVSLMLVGGAKPFSGAQEIKVKVTNRQSREFRGTISCDLAKPNSKVPVTVPPHKSWEFNVPIVLNGAGSHRYKLSLLDDAGTSVREIGGSFQTAPLLTLYPACPCYLVAGQADGRIRLDAQVNVNPDRRAGLKLNIQVLDAQGKSLKTETVDASREEIAGCDANVPVDQPATYIVTANLVDDHGKTIASGKNEVQVVAKSPRVAIGPDGFLRIDGKPHFPIGMYSSGHFEEMSKAGFDVTHNYEITTGEADAPINPNEPRTLQLLDQALSNGLHVMLEIPRKAVEQARWEQVRRFVETFKHHPALICWGSEERVTRGLAPLENIAALHDLLNKLDPDHPFLLGDTRTLTEKAEKDWANFFPDTNMDIGIWWWYPIPVADPVGNELKPDNLLEPPLWLTTAHSRKPLWIAVQAYQQPWKKSRFPTPEEYRCETYLSIIKGVKGLFYYTGYGERDYFGKPAGMLNRPEEGHWDYVQKLVRELREFSPVIMSPQAKGEITISPSNAPVEFVTRESEGKIYLIAANKSPLVQKASFNSTLFKGRRAQVLYENHSAQMEGDSLSDEFPPFAVHIYELTRTE
jgi:hypothetical protein